MAYNILVYAVTRRMVIRPSVVASFFRIAGRNFAKSISKEARLGQVVRKRQCRLRSIHEIYINGKCLNTSLVMAMNSGNKPLVRQPNRPSNIVRAAATLVLTALFTAAPLAETVAQAQANPKSKTSQAADSLTLVKPYPGYGISVFEYGKNDVVDIRMRDFAKELHRVESNLPNDRKTGIDSVVIMPGMPEFYAGMKSTYTTSPASDIANTTTVLVGTGVFNPQTKIQLPNGLVEVTDLTSESNDPRLFADYAIAQKVLQKLPYEERGRIIDSIFTLTKNPNIESIARVFEPSTYVEGSQLPKITSYDDFFYCAALVMMNFPGEFMFELRTLAGVDKGAYSKAVDFAALVIKALGENNFHPDLVRFVAKPSTH